MKKLSTFLCMVLCSIALHANVVSGTCGDNLTWSYDTDTKALTIEGTGDMYDYDYDYGSGSSTQPWAQVNSSILSVSLPDGLTSIGNYAFYTCYSITSINIPDGVTRIGKYAFYQCYALTSITIPNSVTSIGNNAFEDCFSLTSVTIGNSVTSIEDNAFSGCKALTSITIPNSVTSIGGGAFSGCSSITSITIPNSVTSIGVAAFYQCYNLTSITIPDGVTSSIGRHAFYHCYALTSITIPNSVTSIGNSAFYQCDNLTSVTIGNSVTSIEEHAFSGCKALTSITIPNSVTSIGWGAFSGCSSITSITIPNSVTSIGGAAFTSCSQVVVECTTPPTIESSTFNTNASIFVPCSAFDTYLQTAVWQFLDFKGLSHALNLSATDGGTATITATDCDANTATIEAVANELYQFSQWSDGNTDNPRTLMQTQDITLQAEFEPTPSYSVTLRGNSIRGYYQYVNDWGGTSESSWFGYDSEINISVRGGLSVYFYENDMSCGTWLGWSDGVTDNERTITITSDTVITTLFDAPATYQVSITAGENGSLSKVYDDVTLTDCDGQGETISNICATPVDGYIFAGWSDGNTEQCRSINIVSDTTLVAKFAKKPQNVVTGTCGDNLTWSYDTDTKVLTIEGTGDMYDYDYWSGEQPWSQVRNDILSVSLPDGLTRIGSSAFAGCTSITSITIPNSVTSIGYAAYEDCYSLTSVTIPNSVTIIGNSAFSYCNSLASVTLGDSVTNIGNYAFYNCSSLTSVTIPQSVTYIGEYAFSHCSQVVVECTTPPTIQGGAFNSDASIYVPCFTVGVYLAAPVWQFLSIVDDDNYRINLSATKGGMATITATDCEANTATIEATSDSCSHFVQWSDGITDNPRIVNLTQDTTLVAQFESSTYQVNIYAGENGLLGVESDWDYWETDTFSIEMTDCGNELTTNLICAYPDEGYTFAGWSDGNTEECRTLTITQDTTVVALFKEIIYYSVTLRGNSIRGYYQYVNDWGGTSESWFGYNSEINLSVAEGLSVYFFEDNVSCGTWLGWSDGVTDNERTITITSDTVITSLFDVPTYQVNISAAAHGSLTQYGETIDGIATTMTDCDGNGEWINEICAVPDEGYYFIGWSDGYAEACRSIRVVSDTTIVAHFAEKQQVQVLVGVESACKNMGTVSGDGIFYQGDVVTITATPNSGYHFVEWSDGNSIANREIYLTSDTTLFATFAAGDMGGKCGDNLYWMWENGALTITGTGDMDLDTHPAWWQYENLQITSVSMPEGITSIYAWAFYRQPITTILIPASVEEVGDRAFADNEQLTHFEYLGNNIHWGTEYWYWDNKPLNGCHNLQYFRGNTVLGAYYSTDTIIVSNGDAFDDMYSAPYVDNTNATDEELWGYSTNAEVKTIQTLYLPAGLVEIGDYALQNARFLGGITIPEGVTRIGISAFEDCRSMDSVVFAGNNVQEIGAWAFYNCHSLRNLTLPEGVEEIGRAAFFDCVYLTELTIPSTMKKIADNGFAACRKLSTMYVNALVPPTIEAKTFEDVDRATPVFVPRGTMELYQADQYWSEFFNMAEYEAPTGNLNISADEANGMRKVVRDGQVLILRGDKTYTVLGEMIQ